MKKIIWVIIVFLLGGYFVDSYVENNAEREVVRLEKEKIDLRAKTLVKKMTSRSNAITDWEFRLDDGQGFRIDPILTVELEKLWLVENPILFVGSILDIKTKDENNYIIVIERDMFSMLMTDIRLSLVANKDQIDALLEKQPNLIKSFSFDNRIAVIGNVNSIETIYSSGVECAQEDIKMGHGEMIDLEFVGDVQL